MQESGSFKTNVGILDPYLAAAIWVAEADRDAAQGFAPWSKGELLLDLKCVISLTSNTWARPGGATQGVPMGVLCSMALWDHTTVSSLRMQGHLGQWHPQISLPR